MTSSRNLRLPSFVSIIDIKRGLDKHTTHIIQRWVGVVGGVLVSLSLALFIRLSMHIRSSSCRCSYHPRMHHLSQASLFHLFLV